ncbi:MAG: NERD domain-containing protein [Candidatus Nanopelagicales bacterium]
MPVLLIPEHPHFEDESERLVWEALRTHLRDGDVLLHGVRITDPRHGEVEIDLLLLMPDCGAAVIEVKGGHVTFTDGQWRQNDVSGSHEIDPVRQARNGVYALKRYLEGQPTWSRGALRAGWLLAFPYMTVSGAMGPEARRDLILGRDDLPEAAGIAYDRLWSPEFQTPLPGQGWVESALDLLLGVPDTEREILARTEARLRHSDELTAAQATLLAVVRNNPRIEITGSAGTGKTWLAIEQARRWAQAGERVCFVSYGRGVAEMARRATQALPRSQQPAYVGTFHQLGYQWGVHPGPAEPGDFWTAAAPARMTEAAGALDASARFTAFVVDEAQDFADSWWTALLASAASDSFRLAVFRDDEQVVFSDRKGRPDLPLTPLVLDENLRNAKQIVDTFRPLLTSPVTAMGGDGFPVRYIRCDPDAVMDAADTAVMTLHDHGGWLPEHIALLTTKHRHPVQAQQADDKVAYWDGLWADHTVFYSTVSGFKGLERPVVVLAVNGFHDGIDPRSVLYAGMSRARDLLVVVGAPDELAMILTPKMMRRLERGVA